MKEEDKTITPIPFETFTCHYCQTPKLGKQGTYIWTGGKTLIFCCHTCRDKHHPKETPEP